jgi:hypothetical protein
MHQRLSLRDEKRTLQRAIQSMSEVVSDCDMRLSKDANANSLVFISAKWKFRGSRLNLLSNLDFSLPQPGMRTGRLT